MAYFEHIVHHQHIDRHIRVDLSDDEQYVVNLYRMFIPPFE